MPARSQDELERLLAAWDERLRRVDDNLLALEGDPTYRLCEGRLERLEGRTREVLAPVLDGVAALFADRERLGGVVDRARAVHGSMSALTFWDNDARKGEIESLLLGPSITRVDAAPPLARRSLLDEAEHETSETPDAVLARMSSRFDLARDALAAVSAAWAKLEPAAAEARERATRLSREAAAAGVDAREIAEVERAIAAAENDLSRDPLGSVDGFRTNVEARLHALATRLRDVVSARERVASAHAAARALLVAVERAHEEARRDVDAVASEIVLGPGARALVADEAAVRDLAPWLERLAAAAAAGHAGSAEIGLARFWEAGGQLLARDRSASARVAALRAKRDELLGRAEARSAQLAALAARGASLDPSARDLARQALALLRTRPVALGEAASAVEALERALAATR